MNARIGVAPCEDTIGILEVAAWTAAGEKLTTQCAARRPAFDTRCDPFFDLSCTTEIEE
jgi:hypothetical protein